MIDRCTCYTTNMMCTSSTKYLVLQLQVRSIEVYVLRTEYQVYDARMILVQHAPNGMYIILGVLYTWYEVLVRMMLRYNS